MNLLKLSWKNVWHKPLSAGLSILLMALGVALIAFLSDVGSQLERQFIKNLENVHMVVGAKGSPVQIILSSIYHVSPPTGNISYAEAQKLARNPMVEKAIPMSFGDSYRGMRIVGTNHDYIDLYDGKLAEGQLFDKNNQVIIGPTAAKRLELKIGDQFVSNHGLQETEHKHEEEKLTVVGILQPSGTVLDQLILCNLETVWHAHQGHGNQDVEKEITNMLFRFRSKMAHLTMPRMVNENTSMQAAMPAIEVNMLLSNLGVGLQTLWVLGLIVIIVSGLSVFVSLFNAIKERKYELALLRSLGASKLQLLFLPLAEGLILASLGSLLGILFNKLGGLLIYSEITSQYGYQIGQLNFGLNDVWAIFIGLAIGLLAAIIPALSAMNLNISRTLAND